MPDPRMVQALTLDERMRQFGMNPEAERLNVLPNYSQETGWVAPQWLYEMAKGAVLPGHVAQGGAWTPNQVTDMAMALGGSAAPVGMATAPMGAMAMGSGKINKIPRPRNQKLSSKAIDQSDFIGKTEQELQNMSLDILDRGAFGVNDGDVIKISPEKLNIKFPDDMINPQHKFEIGGINWAKSVDLSDPIKVSIDDAGRFNVEDGHHRYFAAKVTGRPLTAEIEIKGNPVRKILSDQLRKK